MFGELRHFPVPELIGMLGRRTGCLMIEHLPLQGRYELYLHSGQLCRFVGAGQRIEDIQEVKRQFGRLSASNGGTFAFHSLDEPQMPQDFSLNLTHLLLSASVAADEYQQYREQLPHPETRFALSRSARAASEICGELRFFLERATVPLQSGISVTELAARLALGLPETQLRLFKLRQLGLVEPQWAGVVASLPTSPVISPLTSSVAGPTTSPVNSPAASAVSAALPVSPPARSPGLLTRLIGALRGKRTSLPVST